MPQRLGHLAFVLALGAVAPATGQPAPTLIAIACTGQARTAGRDGVVTTADETRRYVIDDQRRTLLWFNPATAGFQPVCDRDEGCRPEHGPRAIRFTRTGDRGAQLFALDRTTATLLHSEQRDDRATWFEARCERAAVPKPEGPAAF